MDAEFPARRDLYKWLCLSVRPSVRPFVRPSVSYQWPLQELLLRITCLFPISSPWSTRAFGPWSQENLWSNLVKLACSPFKIYNQFFLLLLYYTYQNYLTEFPNLLNPRNSDFFPENRSYRVNLCVILFRFRASL